MSKRVRGPTGVYWGELPCRAPFELERSTGFDPAVARVRSLRSDVADWVLRHDPDRINLEEQPSGFQSVLPPKVAEVLTAETLGRFKGVAKLPSRAPLVVVEVREEAGKDTAGLPLMWLVDAAPVDDLEPAMIELVLADVRYFWRDYGEITLEVNVPDPSTPEGQNGAPRYAPRSLRRATSPDEQPRPWKVAEVLQLVLDRLPGAPQVRLFPEFRNGVSREVRAVGASPLEVLQALTVDLDLVFAFNLDGTASFFPRGVGAIGENPTGVGSDNPKAHDPRTGKGVWEGEVESNLFSTRPAIDAADEVAVVGPPPVYTVKVDFLDPVLPLDLPETDTAAAERVEFPITPDLLDRVAPIDSRLVLELPGLPNVGRFGTKPREASLDRSQAVRRMALLRLPFFGDRFPRDYDGIPAPLREQLADRLWRFYRLPKRLERLLPILNRAERGTNGGRMRPVVEAFGFKAFEAVVQREETPPPGVAGDSRTLAEVELQEVESLIATTQQAIEGLSPLVAANFAKAWDEWSKRKGAAEGEQAGSQEKANFQKVFEAGRRAAATLLTDALGVKEAAALDPNAVALSELQTRLSDLQRRRVPLLERANPTKALEEQLRAASENVKSIQKATGRIDETAQAAVRALEQKIADARAAKPLATKREVKVVQHANTGRRQVRATIHPDGLVELDEPAVWLADPSVPDPLGTYAVPMPVAITFGTWNRSDPTPYTEQGYRFSQDQQQLTPVANPFMEAAAKLLSAGPPELAIYRPGLGNVLQVARPGMDGRLRFTFNRENRTTGAAEVGPTPYRIVRGEDLQVLLPLDGTSDTGNLEAVRQRAAALADRAFVGAARLTGSMTITGARPVNVNGNISTVRWVSDDQGNVSTVVLFDGQPSTGIESLKDPPSFSGPLVFGIDLSLAEVAR